MEFMRPKISEKDQIQHYLMSSIIIIVGVILNTLEKYTLYINQEVQN